MTEPAKKALNEMARATLNHDDAAFYEAKARFDKLTKGAK
jgi:hypothetical protein